MNVDTVAALHGHTGGEAVPYIVRLESMTAPGMSERVAALHSDDDVERGVALVLNVFRSGSFETLAASGRVRRAELPVASAALFILDQRIWVMDVIPDADSLKVASGALDPCLYRVVANAVLDLALDEGLPLVYFPTKASLAPPNTVPYDTVQEMYSATQRRTLGRQRYWRVESHGVRVIRLEPRRQRCAESCFCVVHSFEDSGNGGAGGGDVTEIINVVLTTAERHSASMTICVPEGLYGQLPSRAVIAPRHSVALRAGGRPGGLLHQLPTLRSAASTVRGLYPCGDGIVPQIAERTLLHFGFTWVLQTQRQASAAMVIGGGPARIVRLTIARGDGRVSPSRLSEWIGAAEGAGGESKACLIELPGAHASHWLPVYERMIEELSLRRPLRSCEDVAAEAGESGDWD